MEYHKIDTVFNRDSNFKVIPDQLRNPVIGTIKTFDWTEKIDGTNIRIIWDIATKQMRVGGRTDNAQIPGDLVQHVYNLVTPSQLEVVFPDVDAIIYGEGYGAGIQKGNLLSPIKKFIAFDVLVNGKWWLDHQDVVDVCMKLELDMVPYYGEMPLEQAVQLVRNGFDSRLGEHPPAEGLVGRPLSTLYDKHMKRIIIKLKTKDF